MTFALKAIEAHAQILEEHPLFITLWSVEPEYQLKQAVEWTAVGAFWTLAFPDLLKMNVEAAEDPEVRRVLAQHLVEDTGHDQWFLEDLQVALGVAPSIQDLFSPAAFDVRAVTYALASEVVHADSDFARLVIVEALEAAAAVFFGSISKFLERSGHAGKLKYLAGVHIAAEAGHEIHDDDHHQWLEKVGQAADESERTRAVVVVERVFAAFERLADALVISFAERKS